MSQLLSALAFAAVIMSAAACGSPDPERRDFVFTPVPYTPRAAQPECDACARALVCNADGRGYYGDQVAVTAELARKDKIRSVAESYGFTILRTFDHERQATVSMSIEVPPGSSPAAAAALAKEQGVITVEPSGYLYGDRDPCSR